MAADGGARRNNHYREARPRGSEEHPIDEVVERRIRHARLRAGIRAAQGQVVRALGEQRALYLRLDEMLNRQNADREEAYFNEGFEQGLMRGRAEALAGAKGDRDARAIRAELIRVVTHRGARASAGIRALLEVAWGMTRR
jgi:hypothetical protein